jgi:hypothetical protein
VIDLGEVRKEGVDLKKISTVFSVAWGGVKSGQSFKLDDLYVE